VTSGHGWETGVWDCRVASLLAMTGEKGVRASSVSRGSAGRLALPWWMRLFESDGRSSRVLDPRPEVAGYLERSERCAATTERRPPRFMVTRLGAVALNGPAGMQLAADQGLLGASAPTGLEAADGALAGARLRPMQDGSP